MIEIPRYARNDKAELHALIANALCENNYTVTENKIAQFANYLQLLQLWNQKFNLTAITDTREMVYLHLIDSLAVLPYLQGERLLDVGSGGGFPGMVLAIMQPDKHWVLLDKSSKKTRFLTQVAAELALKNVEVIQSRLEDFKPPLPFDSIVARAFATIKILAKATEHLLSPHGIVIAMKGKYPKDELDELPPHFHIEQLARVEIVGMERERHIICLSKKEGGQWEKL